MTGTQRAYRSIMPVPAADLSAWHARPGAFQRLTPPWMDVRVLQDGGIGPGSKARLRISIAGPVHTNWQIVHEELPDGAGFADVQESGPFASWRHEHRFDSIDASTSVLIDSLDYELPFGGVGQAVAGGKVERRLDELFAFRHRRTRIDLARHLAASSTPRHVAITGATGLVGTRLVSFLRTGGHTVSRIVRRPTGADDEISWDPARGEIDAARLEGVDAVVHLAGTSIAGGLWTGRRKAAIRDSRVEGTTLLATTLAGLDNPPGVFVSTSAVGFYGSRGDEMLTETSASGEGFLAHVCRDWEAAARPAANAGIRVVHPRFGVVMAGEGGMLPILARLFSAGLGGKLGGGRQYFAWIALDDLLGILLDAIVSPDLDGPINAVAPQQITNAEFTRALGTVLHRPTIFRAPDFPFRMLSADMANDLILVSQRVEPTRLDIRGFTFAFPTIEVALRHELGKSAGHPEVDAAAATVQPPPVPFTRRDAA